MRDKNKTYTHYSFKMNNDSWDAVDYLRANHINMSNVVRQALIKEVERQKLIREKYPEGF